MIVTIDGPAGAGKSTVASRVARRLGLPCLNSGSIYRAVTLRVLETGVSFDDTDRVRALIAGLALRFAEGADGGPRVLLAGRDVTWRLREPDVTSQIYRVANRPEVRAALVDLQRSFAEPDGVVAEGRDMGTVIFPHADHKFYLDASPQVRARRQQRQLEAAGLCRPSFAEVLESVIARDAHDSERDHSPLRVAEGAVVIDTDGLGVDDVIERVMAEVEQSRV